MVTGDPASTADAHLRTIAAAADGAGVAPTAEHGAIGAGVPVPVERIKSLARQRVVLCTASVQQCGQSVEARPARPSSSGRRQAQLRQHRTYHT